MVAPAFVSRPEQFCPLTCGCLRNPSLRFKREIHIEGHLRPPPAAWTEEYPTLPEMELGATTSRGCFMIPDAVFKPFLENDATCMEAHALMASLKREADSADAPKWVAVARGSPEALAAGLVQGESENISTHEPAHGGLVTVEQLKSSELMAADTPTPNGKLHLHVTKDGKCYVHVLADVAVAKGERLLGMGSGGRKSDVEAAKCKENGMVTFPIKIESDATEVFYISEGSEKFMTLYALLAQLTLEGHRTVGLSYHILTPAEDGRAARHKVESVRPKFWGAKRSRSADPNSRWEPSNIGALLSYEEVPNNFVKASAARHADTVLGVAVALAVSEALATLSNCRRKRL